jgi:hypothetical protein
MKDAVNEILESVLMNEEIRDESKEQISQTFAKQYMDKLDQIDPITERFRTTSKIMLRLDTDKAIRLVSLLAKFSEECVFKFQPNQLIITARDSTGNVLQKHTLTTKFFQAYFVSEEITALVQTKHLVKSFVKLPDKFPYVDMYIKGGQLLIIVLGGAGCHLIPVAMDPLYIKEFIRKLPPSDLTPPLVEATVGIDALLQYTDVCMEINLSLKLTAYKASPFPPHKGPLLMVSTKDSDLSADYYCLFDNGETPYQFDDKIVVDPLYPLKRLEMSSNSDKIEATFSLLYLYNILYHTKKLCPLVELTFNKTQYMHLNCLANGAGLEFWVAPAFSW